MDLIPFFRSGRNEFRSKYEVFTVYRTYPTLSLTLTRLAQQAGSSNWMTEVFQMYPATVYHITFFFRCVCVLGEPFIRSFIYFTFYILHFILRRLNLILFIFSCLFIKYNIMRIHTYTASDWQLFLFPSFLSSVILH